MKTIIEQLLEIHQKQLAIDAVVPTCGITSTPQWHILEFNDFCKVMDNLGVKTYAVKDTKTTSYRYRCYFNYAGVEVICLRATIPRRGNYELDTAD